MTDVQIKTTEPQTVAFIRMHGAYEQIPMAMGQLYGWAAQRGLQPAGEPSAVYFTDPATTDESENLWEVRAPLAGEPEPSDEDESGCGIANIESKKVAFAMHKGPYETIPDTYEALGVWIAAQGLTVVGPPEESYFSDPATTAAEDYLTEVRMPVR